LGHDGRNKDRDLNSCPLFYFLKLPQIEAHRNRAFGSHQNIVNPRLMAAVGHFAAKTSSLDYDQKGAEVDKGLGPWVGAAKGKTKWEVEGQANCGFLDLDGQR
jgi:hypothetical protein